MPRSHLHERVATSRMFANLLACMLLLVMSAASSEVQAQTFTDLHDFNCATDGCDGSFPGIVAQGRDGNLYGSLPAGGNGSGTVYKITPAGTVNAIYTFSGSDGSGSTASLTAGFPQPSIVSLLPVRSKPYPKVAARFSSSMK